MALEHLLAGHMSHFRELLFVQYYQSIDQQTLCLQIVGLIIFLLILTKLPDTFGISYFEYMGQLILSIVACFT